MILAASFEFWKRHNAEIVERPTDDDEVRQVRILDWSLVFLIWLNVQQGHFRALSFKNVAVQKIEHYKTMPKNNIQVLLYGLHTGYISPQSNRK